MTMVDPDVHPLDGQPASPLVVERVAHCVVVGADTRYLDRYRPGPNVPPESGRLPVLVDPAAVAAFSSLAPDLVHRLDRQLPLGPVGRRGGVRLLVNDAARDDAGGPGLAARLSQCLDIDIVAPQGGVAWGSDSLLALGPDGAWHTFTGGRRVATAGPRVPSPPWQNALPPDVRALGVGSALTITTIPAGLWLRAGRGGTPPDAGAAFDIPPSTATMAVLVGAGGEPTPDPAEVRAVLAALPPALREYAVLLAGRPDLPIEEFAAEVVAGLPAGVLVAHVVPVRTSGGVEFMAVDAHGARTWRPYVSISRYRDDGAPRPWLWTAPLPEFAVSADGVHELAADWAVEVVPSGLVVRPLGCEPAPLVRRRAVQGDRVVLTVTGGAQPPPDEVVDAVSALVERLPERHLVRLDTPDAYHAGAVAAIGHRLGAPVEASAGIRRQLAAEPAPAAATQPAGEAATQPADEAATEPGGEAATEPGGEAAIELVIDRGSAREEASPPPARPRLALRAEVPGAAAGSFDDADAEFAVPQRPPVSVSADGRIRLAGRPLRARNAGSPAEPIPGTTADREPVAASSASPVGDSLSAQPVPTIPAVAAGGIGLAEEPHAEAGVALAADAGDPSTSADGPAPSEPSAGPAASPRTEALGQTPALQADSADPTRRPADLADLADPRCRA